jgi:hypothetical protein
MQIKLRQILLVIGFGLALLHAYFPLSTNQQLGVLFITLFTLGIPHGALDFYIDQVRGLINFSSNMVGKVLVLKYVSDGLAKDEEMVVHKFAEEALYLHIAYSILSTRANSPEYLVARFKRDRAVAKRNAKIRLSNIKIEEIAQVMRGKSKQIKH